MAYNEYTTDPEFRFELTDTNHIHTVFSPFMSQRFCLNQELKRSNNIYGIAGYKDDLKAKVSSASKNDYQHLINSLNNEDERLALDALNYLFLDNDFKELINCLFYDRYIVRKGAFTLLLENIEINNKTALFFQSFFVGKNPALTIMIPSGFEGNYRKHLDREVIRWLTSMFTEIGNNPIWQPYLNMSIESQENKPSVEEENSLAETLPEMQLKMSSLVTDVLNWIIKINQAPQTVISNDLQTNPKKIYHLRSKWQKASNKIKTSHKFLTRLIEHWTPGKPSEFTNAFEVFYTGLSKGSKQVFFIYCSSSEDESIQTISWKFITEFCPINPKDIFRDSKYAQQLTKAIYQAKLYGEQNNHHLNFQVICRHYSDLLTQLREMENIYIPLEETHFDLTWADCQQIPPIAQIRKAQYPHTKSHLQNYHFEVKNPKIRFSNYNEEMPCSALQILAISGIAIETVKSKQAICPSPVQLPAWESQYRNLFKASSKFDPRYHKTSSKNNRTKKVKNKTLDDIFNTTPDKSENEKNEQNISNLDDLFN